MPNPIVFFQIATSDLPAARAFYGELFDWTISETGGIDPGGPADFDTTGAFRALPEGQAPFVTPWFRVDDLWKTLERAMELGAQEVLSIRQQPGGAHFCIVRAPDGQTLGLVQA
jgi:uncharacterized protein